MVRVYPVAGLACSKHFRYAMCALSCMSVMSVLDTGGKLLNIPPQGQDCFFPGGQ